MAHGTGGRLDEAGGIRLLAEYDDGEPMSYAEVEVRAPEDNPVFQTGRTDRNGVFLFLPDHGGKWRVTVNDGMGHQLVLAREITGTGTFSPQAVASPATVPGKSRWPMVIAGLGIVYGSAGFVYGFRERMQRLRSRRNAAI